MTSTSSDALTDTPVTHTANSTTLGGAHHQQIGQVAPDRCEDGMCFVHAAILGHDDDAANAARWRPGVGLTRGAV
jgi:hypothetical protein